jgi:hypothetical protein
LLLPQGSCKQITLPAKKQIASDCATVAEVLLPRYRQSESRSLQLQISGSSGLPETNQKKRNKTPQYAKSTYSKEQVSNTFPIWNKGLQT